MGRQRDPKRDEAFSIYKASGGKINLNVIAAELEVSDATIRSWKNRDGWDTPEASSVAKNNSATLQKVKRNATDATQRKDKKAVREKEIKLSDIENDDLTDKQRLFCLHYVKSFNATFSAIKAGYAKDSAHVQGSVLLSNPKVSEEIQRLKGMITQVIFADVMDVFNKYAAIAFADITDYVEFGQKDEIMMSEEGPILDPVTGEHMTYKRNFVTFKNSDEVDGTLISEIKQGKEGVSVKLHDKMKAMEKLEKYFDMLPDHHKRALENERLKMDRERLELDKAKAAGEGDLDEEIIDDWVGAVMDNGGNESRDQQEIPSIQEANTGI